jgi:HEAT repeat protein
MSSVFISYSHDPKDPTHADRVAGLAASLLEGGLEVFFDEHRGDEEEEVPWEIWMEDKILEADYVLMVCTELYLKKIRQQIAEDEGLGVCWEAGIIYSLLYRVKRNTTKFLPVGFSPEDKGFIPLPLQGKQWFVIDTQSGYERLYAFLTRQHRNRFPKRGSALQTVAQKTIEPLFALPGKTPLSTQTGSASVLEDRISAANPWLTLKPDIQPAPRQDIRGLDWYEECDAGHFIGRNDDTTQILAMLLSHPVIRLVGPSGIGKSSLIRAGLLPRIREFGWRSCVIRPFEDPAERIPTQLTAELLTSPGNFTMPFDPSKFTAEVRPLLSNDGINRLVLFLDQFEDIVSPMAASQAVDTMREFLQELWQQKETKPYLRAVVVYRTDADARLGRLWQDVSSKSEGLPYFALQGLSRSVAEEIINRAAREQGWRLEARVREISHQLRLESQKLNCSDEIFPVYLQIFLKQAEQRAEERITEDFINSLGGMSGLIGKYLEQTLESLKARGGDWQRCGAVLESLSRSSGAKAVQSLDNLIRETGLSRAVLAEMLPVLVHERLIRPVGHESYEIQHDVLAAAVIESMKDSDRDAKAAREFLAAKVSAFEKTMIYLATNELVYLYRYRRKIDPTKPELRLLLASTFHELKMGGTHQPPGAYWFAKFSPPEFLDWFVQIERWIAKESNSYSYISYKWLRTFPICGLESQFAILAKEPVLSLRAICAQWIGQTKRDEDLTLLRKLSKDEHEDVRLAAVKAMASFSKEEVLPLLRECAREDPYVRLVAVEALASFSKEEDLHLWRQLIRDANSDVRSAAVMALASFSKEEDLQRLTLLLCELTRGEHQNARLRTAVVQALTNYSKEKALPLLLELVNDLDWRVRLVAVEALASFPNEEVLLLFHKLANNESAMIRTTVAKALASFPEKEALPLLVELAKGPDLWVRSAAVAALATFHNENVLPLLREWTRGEEQFFVRDIVVQALANFAKEEDLPLLRKLTRDHTSSVSGAAVKALATFSKEEDLPLLRKSARNERWDVRAAAVKALARFAQKDDLALLCELTRDRESDVRVAAMKGLANFSTEEVLPLLRELSKDQTSGIRAAAAVKALASFSKEEDAQLLRERALAPDNDVAAEAVRGLASLCSHQELEVFLNQNDQELCVGALAALDELLYRPKWLKEKNR